MRGWREGEIPCHQPHRESRGGEQLLGKRAEAGAAGAQSRWLRAWTPEVDAPPAQVPGLPLIVTPIVILGQVLAFIDEFLHL